MENMENEFLTFFGAISFEWIGCDFTHFDLTYERVCTCETTEEDVKH
jgi:hypothetical protein